MAKYRPKRVEPQYDQGERGHAQVRYKGKYILVRFDETENVHKFRKLKKYKKMTPGKWNVRLNGDETEIYSFVPVSGNFKGKVSSFVGGDDGPQPKTKYVDFHKKDGTHVKYDYDYFTVLIEILEPEKQAGVEVPYILRYNLLEDEDGMVGLMSKGSRTKELAEFLDLAGAWNRGEMEWSDNVLPEFEKRILRADQPFHFLMKDGWIDTLYEADEPEEADDWEDPEEVAEDTPEPKKEVATDEEEEIDWED
jgi:hypothetical protein